MSVKEKMTTIADAIRAKTGESEPLSLDGMAQGVDKVFAAGEQSEYDRFWDVFQENGRRGDYRYVFAGTAWTQETLKPKYDIIVNDAAQSMFHVSGFAGDLAQYLENIGVKLDISKASNVHSLFNSAQSITRVGTINITSAGVANSALFAYCGQLNTIDKLVVSATNAWVSTFVNCSALQNLAIEGTVGTTGLNLQWSTKLSKASIASVVNALSATTSSLSATFSKTAVDAAFETSAGAADGSVSAEWTALANTKSNWTINLA